MKAQKIAGVPTRRTLIRPWICFLSEVENHGKFLTRIEVGAGVILEGAFHVSQVQVGD